jgi:hypothetical protein
MLDGIRVASEEITEVHTLLTFGRNTSSSRPIGSNTASRRYVAYSKSPPGLLRLAVGAGVEASIGTCQAAAPDQCFVCCQPEHPRSATCTP